MCVCVWVCVSLFGDLYKYLNTRYRLEFHQGVFMKVGKSEKWLLFFEKIVTLMLILHDVKLSSHFRLKHPTRANFFKCKYCYGISRAVRIYIIGSRGSRDNALTICNDQIASVLQIITRVIYIILFFFLAYQDRIRPLI